MLVAEKLVLLSPLVGGDDPSVLFLGPCGNHSLVFSSCVFDGKVETLTFFFLFFLLLLLLVGLSGIAGAPT